ncbi:hypothetical protein SDC9_165654 [bioreactor metagenome]|uniref:Uncharacterized protein n=1 Tax=bioreactor metagenome TaxID=1076179 RepID=A0A645G2C9_9ZZZZ
MNYIAALYMIIVAYMSIRKKIYIKIYEDSLQYKGVFKSTSIKYSDVKSIKVNTQRGIVSSMKFYCSSGKIGTIKSKMEL